MVKKNPELDFRGKITKLYFVVGFVGVCIMAILMSGGDTPRGLGQGIGSGAITSLIGGIALHVSAGKTPSRNRLYVALSIGLIVCLVLGYLILNDL